MSKLNLDKVRYRQKAVGVLFGISNRDLNPVFSAQVQPLWDAPDVTGRGGIMPGLVLALSTDSGSCRQ